MQPEYKLISGRNVRMSGPERESQEELMWRKKSRFTCCGIKHSQASMEMCKETINKSRRTETALEQQVFNFVPVISDDERARISFKAEEINCCLY